MKKSILSIVAVVAFSGTVFSQIPNNSFETWTAVGTYSNPTSWDQLNGMTTSMGVYTATKGIGGASGGGSSYLKLISKTVGTMGVVPGVAVSGAIDMATFKPKSGFPFTLQPLKLTGSWQYMASGADAGFIAVYLTKWNMSMMKRDTIAKALQPLVGMAMSWLNFNINLTYMSSVMPDSALIVLSASGATPVANSYLYIDNLLFSGSVTGINPIENVISNVSVFPNPTTENVGIEINVQQIALIKFQLIDFLGKLVKDLNVGEVQGKYSTSINTNGLAKGTYFLKIIANDAVETKKIIIQ